MEWAPDNNVSVNIDLIPERIFALHWINPSKYTGSLTNLIKKLNDRSIKIDPNFDFVIGYSKSKDKYYLVARAPIRASDVYRDLKAMKFTEAAPTVPAGTATPPSKGVPIEASSSAPKSVPVKSPPAPKEDVIPSEFRGIISDNFETSRYISLLPLSDYGTQGKLLGEGSYGAVYIYTSPSGNYAVKKMRSLDPNTHYDTSILREISALVRLNHPNVVDIYDVYVEGGDTDMIMSLGTSDLNSLIKSDIIKSNFPVQKGIAYQILRGVAYCLNRGVLNRDIKPQNVIIYKDYQAKISDFGLSRAFGCASPTENTKMLYTIWYRPPEVLLNGDYKDSADIWAVGCLLYEIFAGTPLFAYNNEDQIIRWQFAIFGTPDPTGINPRRPSWPSVVDLPGWPTYGHYIYFTDYSRLSPTIRDNPDLLRMLEKMLQMNPANRQPLEAVMTSDVFNDIRSAVEERFPFKDVSGLSCDQKLSLRERYPAKSLNRSSALQVIYKYANEERVFRAGIFATYIFDCVNGKVDIHPNDMPLACLSIALNYEINKQLPFDASFLAYAEIEIAKYLRYDLMISTSVDFLVTLANMYPDTVKLTSLGVLYLLTATDLVFTYLPNIIAKTSLLVACVYHSETCKHGTHIIPQVIELYNELLKINSIPPYDIFGFLLPPDFLEKIKISKMLV